MCRSMCMKTIEALIVDLVRRQDMGNASEADVALLVEQARPQGLE